MNYDTKVDREEVAYNTVFWILALAIAGGVAYALFQWFGYDYKYSAPQTIQAYVSKKEYYAPYSTITIMPMGKVMMPQTHNHPARYEVSFKTSSDQNMMINNKDIFEKLTAEQAVTLTYQVVTRGLIFFKDSEFYNYQVTDVK